MDFDCQNSSIVSHRNKPYNQNYVCVGFCQVKTKRGTKYKWLPYNKKW